MIPWLALSDAQNVRDAFELLAYLRGKRRRRRADTPDLAAALEVMGTMQGDVLGRAATEEEQRNPQLGRVLLRRAIAYGIFLRLAFRPVVPANAGTHTARILVSALEQRPFSIFEARGDGSLRSQGRPAESLCEAMTESTHGSIQLYAIALVDNRGLPTGYCEPVDRHRNGDDRALVGRHHEAGDAGIMVTVH